MAALLQGPSGATRYILCPGSLKDHVEAALVANWCFSFLLQAELADLFASFLSLAGSLASATAEVVQRAGSRLYSELFLAFQDAYFRQVGKQSIALSMQLVSVGPCLLIMPFMPLWQEVLRALHSHLGSRLPAQVSTALAALLEMSGKHAELLLGYSAFLTNILEYIEDFTSPQLMQVHHRQPWLTHVGDHKASRMSSPRLRVSAIPFSQVCELFSMLAIAGALDTCSSASRSQGANGRDEYQIMLRKFICSLDVRRCCIGFAGIVCFAKCLSTAAASPETPATFQARCLDSARELLDYGFSACKAAPHQQRHVMYTCLCDSLTAVVASVNTLSCSNTDPDAYLRDVLLSTH